MSLPVCSLLFLYFAVFGTFLRVSKQHFGSTLGSHSQPATVCTVCSPFRSSDTVTLSSHTCQQSWLSWESPFFFLGVTFHLHFYLFFWQFFSSFFPFVILTCFWYCTAWINPTVSTWRATELHQIPFPGGGELLVTP